METPYTDHIKREEYEFVYEPAEDTFLLLDALEIDLPFIENISPQVCLEIGSGSGVIITALSKRLKNSFCLASDINNYACMITKRTSLHNKGFVEPVNMNFATGLREKSIDLLLFNPPYVVTENEELSDLKLETNSQENSITNGQLVRSWAGGENGRAIIDSLLVNLNSILSVRGVFYLLILKENQPDVIISKLHKIGFNAEQFMERRIPGEQLYVLKITRQV